MSEQRKKIVAINASSMADIAFLLLIFFLVTTTLDIDKGLKVLLPPSGLDTPVHTQYHKRNVLDILTNAKDQLLVKGELLDIADLRTLTKKHVNNHGHLPEYSTSPTHATVYLNNTRDTNYDFYVAVQNELRAAYNELRNDYALKHFGIKYQLLDDWHKRKVSQKYPLRITEAENVDID